MRRAALATLAIIIVVVGLRLTVWAPHGSFSSAGSTIQRYGHTATLLTDGRVLIAGGDDRSAELYDPKTSTFSVTGSMHLPHAEHTANLLADGEVLIAGGDDAVSQNVAELYDPRSGTFSYTGSMLGWRTRHTATLLADGRVLLAGGGGTGSGQTADLYDPATGTFTAAGSMTTARDGHTATLLPDGRVLIVGGDRRVLEATEYLASAEIYDPRSGTFTATGSLAIAREGHTATLLPDGRALIVGGSNGSDYLATAEVYDPKTGAFSQTGSMATGRWRPTATLLPDGRVLIAGGEGGIAGHGGGLTSAEIYDPKGGGFGGTGSMTTGRFGHTATLLAGGRVLIVGGYPYDHGHLDSAELYQP